MTPEQAHIWNAAIDAALRDYDGGRAAIRALRARQVVTVEHIGLSTKQEVVDIESRTA